MRKILKEIFCGVALVFLMGSAVAMLGGCSKEKFERPNYEDEQDSELGDPEDEEGIVTMAKFTGNIRNGATLEIPISGEWLVLSKGFSKGDEITVTLLSDSNVTYTLECKSASDETGAIFEVPEDPFIGGMCKVKIKTTTINKAFVRAVDNTEVTQKTGYHVYGKVVDLDGKPIVGAVVSDGVEVTKTDSKGCYWIKSGKTNPFVFVSVPSGYMAPVKKTVPQFFWKLKYKAGIYEMHNFVLDEERNDEHRLVVYTDTHLANRTKDRDQFQDYFIPEIEDQIDQAEDDGVKLYGLALGDLAWDEWWYKNQFGLEDYLDEIGDLNIPIYSIPGNHDNDPYIEGDYKAARAWRDNVGPTYYSVNIGDIHYIMMDDTIFHNKGGVDVQDYETGFTDEQMKWLKADLETLNAGSTIIFGIHIQWTNRPAVKGTFDFCMPSKYREQLTPLLSKHTVHFVSGHTHTNYTNFITPKMTEHNIAGVCGTWWWTGYYSSNICRLNGDGSPSGYKIFNIDGEDITWSFKVLDRDEDYQFRAYNMNQWQLTRTVPFTIKGNKITNTVFDTFCRGYNKPENTSVTRRLLINVFDYNTNWTIKVTQGNTTRTPTRIEGYDPLHVVQFNLRRMADNSSAVDTFGTGKTTHLFETTLTSTTGSITIEANDGQGNTYREMWSLADLSVAKMAVAKNKW